MALLLSLSRFLLLQHRPSSKLLAMAGGKWCFVLQFRRQLMCVFHQYWRASVGKIPRDRISESIADEILMVCAGAPLLYIDFRAAASELVTCSDASEEAAGACRSTGTTPLADQTLELGLRAAGCSAPEVVCLVETFGGIGGARRACELLGVPVAAHFHIDNDEHATRVTKQAWPQALHIGDVKDAGPERFREMARHCARITTVVNVAGAPCQDVSGMNAARVGADGARSGLKAWIPAITAQLKEAFPDAEVGELCENVASMSSADQRQYDALAGSMPVRICPKRSSWVRRPRLYWPSWKLLTTPDAEIEEKGRWTEVRLLAPRPRKSSWLPRGWALSREDVTLHIFTRAIPRKRPPFKPVGISSCDEAILARWDADEYRYPPY
jgi:hypothetical protein